MKLHTALFTAAILLASLAGCGKDTVPGSSSVTTDPTTAVTITETSAEPSSETQEFDFEAAVNDTFICGQRLTYPVKWGQFSDDFTVAAEGAFSDADRNKISCFVNYKGKEIGVFIFTGTTTIEGISADTAISFIDVRSTPEITDVPVYSFRGLEFHDKKEDVTGLLGEPGSIGPNGSSFLYDRIDGERRQVYRFSFGTLGEDDFDGVNIVY